MTPGLAQLLVELALKSSIVLAIAFAASVLARRASAEERHLLWAFALASLLVLPALSVSGPRFIVPVPGFLVPAEPVSDSAASTAPDVSGAAAGVARAPGNAAIWSADEGVREPVGSRVAPERADAALLATVAYATVALALLAWFGAGSVNVALSLRKLENVTDVAALDLLEEIRRRRGIRRTVRLKSSSSDVSPWAWGLLRPVIVLPDGFGQMPAESRRSAIEHELAHIVRLDFLTTMLGFVCCALYWFQPLAWLALRRMTREGEHACDDRVLLAGSHHTTYAAQLLDVARTIHGGNRPMMATAMAGASPVSQRITSILDLTSRRRTVNKKKIVCTSLLTLTLVVPLAALTSQDTGISTVTDPADDEFQALVQKGPADSDELALIVRTFAAHDRSPDVVNVLVEYITRGGGTLKKVTDPMCDFCGSILITETFSRHPDELLPLLLSAFDEVEKRARAAGDGDLLLRLAAISGASGSDRARERGTYYLLEGFRIGNLSDESKLAAVQFLDDMGWYSQAKSLVEKLHDDEASSLYQSAETQSWLKRLDYQITHSNVIAQRLLTPDVSVDTDGDMRPLYRRAPVYPPAALAQGREAEVVLNFTINELGKTENIRVVSSTDSAFDHVAVEAISGFLYAPRLVNGVPVAKSDVRTTIRFLLEP